MELLRARRWWRRARRAVVAIEAGVRGREAMRGWRMEAALD
jgi:hypothetical protein